MVKKFKIKSTILTVIMMVSLFSVTAFADSTNGTERSFYVTLPSYYGNTYFTSRTKETNLNYGRIYALDYTSGGSCNGYTAWFCKGGTTNPITYIASDLSFTTWYSITYTSNYSAGSSVRLGLEDADNTGLFQHTVGGTVNYK